MDTLTDENALKEEDESGAELLIPQPDRLQLSFERITAVGTYFFEILWLGYVGYVDLVRLD